MPEISIALTVSDASEAAALIFAHAAIMHTHMMQDMEIWPTDLEGMKVLLEGIVDDLDASFPDEFVEIITKATVPNTETVSDVANACDTLSVALRHLLAFPDDHETRAIRKKTPNA